MSGISADGQCHFFAGIGGWPLALRLAGWPENRPVWTGSCPCQPFSVAGRNRKGFDDERHVWPQWYRLIAEYRPPVIFGEQVGGKAGEAWIDLVFNDLEAIGYACGAVTFPACSVGAPHIRQRLYWVADTTGQRRDREHALLRQEPEETAETSRRGKTGRMADAHHEGPQGRGKRGNSAGKQSAGAGSVGSFWAGCDWLPCSDERQRPVEPGTFPMADGIPARMGRLRGYGNAIVVPQAVEFIKAYMEL